MTVKKNSTHRHRHPLLEQLIADVRVHPEQTFLPFWGPIPTLGKLVGKGCLCQWWDSPFEVDGIRYQTAEHYMMAEKARLFGDHAMAAKIAQSKDPSDAQYLGRKVQGYDDSVWVAARFDIVVQGNYYKFLQHPELRDYLLATGNSILVSANPTDSVWSIGYDEDHPYVSQPERWRGANLLGFALMQVRAQLQAPLSE